MSKEKFTPRPWNFFIKMCASAPDMYKLLLRFEDYFQNRHIYGYGVEEKVSSDLMSEIKKVRRKLEGKIWEK